MCFFVGVVVIQLCALESQFFLTYHYDNIILKYGLMLQW